MTGERKESNRDENMKDWRFRASKPGELWSGHGDFKGTQNVVTAFACMSRRAAIKAAQKLARDYMANQEQARINKMKEK
jgi:hypothetical protein